MERFESLPPPDEGALTGQSLGETAASASSPEERRRRRRRTYRQPGWVYRGQEVMQVQMRNVSGEGAGFVCDLPPRKAERLHLKAGLGSTRRPRLAEVVFIRQRPDGRYDVGVRFVR